jgi:hypothetical protein
MPRLLGGSTTTARGWFARACLVLALALVTGLLGVTYVYRLCDHSGHYLVSVSDSVALVPARPRHAVMVLVDGLTLSRAQRFDSVRRLRQHGQCRRMTSGPITISRPMYAVLSTGLEQDRTGCRNNDADGPLTAQSIWQLARRSGLRVTAHVALPWWAELFPHGFDHYAIAPEDDNYFVRTKLADLTLIHPLYVDHAGHLAGAASPLYEEAAQRADHELALLLDRLDLAQDTVVLTADHGHRPDGGHGGPQPDVAGVLTCFAGRGVARRADLGRIASTTVAPALALLLGVPFPSHMRAGEDDLDTLFEIIDPAAFPAEYLAHRRAAVERFRDHNREQLARWLGTPSASWSALYARETAAHHRRGALAFGVLAAVLAVVLRRRRIGWRGALGFLVWAGLTLAATLTLYVALSGSLDLSSINGRWRFIGAGMIATLTAGAGAYLVNRRHVADRVRLAEDWFCLALGIAGLALSEPFVHGLKMGFPVPGPTTVFLPLLAPILVTVHALASCELCVREIRR